LLGLAVAALIGIFFLLQAAFGSWRLATAVFIVSPAALMGGVLVAFAGGGTVSLGTVIGLLMLLGIAARNGMSLIKHYHHLEQYEGESFGAELVRRGTQERFVPIMMTALVTAVMLLPFALRGDLAGLEIVHPMARVILGGLVISTLLSLFGVPAVYLLFGAQHEADLGLQVTVVTEEEMREAIANAREMGTAQSAFAKP